MSATSSDPIGIGPASCPASLQRTISGTSFVEAELGAYRIVPVRRGQWYRLYRIERGAE